MEANNQQISIERQLAIVKHSLDELNRQHEVESSLRIKVNDVL